MKCTKGKVPSTSKGSAPSTDAHGSRKVNESNSNRGKYRNNAGGQVSGDGRKTVANNEG